MWIHHKKIRKLKECDMQYVDITFNGRFARAMVNRGADANIMTNKATKGLEMSYIPSNA